MLEYMVCNARTSVDAGYTEREGHGCEHPSHVLPCGCMGTSTIGAYPYVGGTPCVGVVYPYHRGGLGAPTLGPLPGLTGHGQPPWWLHSSVVLCVSY